MSIDCPWCGPRNEDEFVCGGEAGVRRPPDPAAMTDEAWARFLFVRDTPRGPHRERWRHLYGCGQWFHVERDTVSHAILGVWRMDEAPPETGS